MHCRKRLFLITATTGRAPTTTTPWRTTLRFRRAFEMLMLTVCTLSLPRHALPQAREPQESLLIAPGDQVHIHVVEASELDQTVQVDDQGDVRLPLGGIVPVKGLSAAMAADAIAGAYIRGHFLLHPHVGVAIDKYATQNVTVFGQVKSPGSYFVATPRTVVDVLALAGGLTEVADRNVTLQRATTGEYVSYFVSNDPTELLKDNSAMVYPGDRIAVGRISLVYLIGNFNKPGGYPGGPNDGQISMLQAEAFAGGLPPTAVPSRARLIRKREDGSYLDMRFDLSAMQKGKVPDMMLQNGDIVYVPYSYLRDVVAGVSGLVSSAAVAAIYATH